MRLSLSIRSRVRAGSVAALLASPLVALASVPSPSTAAGSSDWKQVSTGGAHSCGIRTTGRLYCWGLDEYGQLGDGGTLDSRPTPVQVSGGGTWIRVSAGYLHTCAVRSTGALYCWGDDSAGQLGDGAASAGVGAPQLVAGSITDWRSVTAGETFTCAVRAVGRLYCWGNDVSGQLGNGAARRDRATPTQTASRSTDWKQVAAGLNHACALRTTGRLYCWGSNTTGEVGSGSDALAIGVPVQVSGGRTDWSSVDAGGDHTCAMRTSRRLYCWGDDTYGQLGDGAEEGIRTTPGQVIGGARDWSRVVVGRWHTCALKTTGRGYCWGYDADGELGDGDPLTRSAQPRQLAGAATDWRTIDSSATSRHTCATTSARRLYCWGSNARWQLGTTTLNPWSPEPVETHS